MAFTERLILTPLQWTIWMIIGIIGLILTGCTALFEYKKRRSETSWFASDYMRITSAVSIGCGVTSTTMQCLELIPGFCYLQHTVGPIAVGAQFLFLGLYQLSRLHYCFSQNSANHHNGYPQWTFVVMVTVGVLTLMFFAMLMIFGRILPSRCGLVQKYSFEWEYDDSVWFRGDPEDQMNEFYRWYFMLVVLGSIWDIIILLMYYFKIKSFRKTKALRKDAVWRKVMFILQRIIILTLFYQLTLLIANSSLIAAGYITDTMLDRLSIHHVARASFNVLYSIVVYLMMEHNTDEYLGFLRCFKRLYLNYICFCCCHRMVDRQLEDFAVLQKAVEKESNRTQNLSISITLFPNTSENVKYSNHTNGAGGSPLTVTRE